MRSLLPLDELEYDCQNAKIKEIMSKEPPFEYGPSIYAVGRVYFEEYLDLGNGDFYVGEVGNEKPHGRGVKIYKTRTTPYIHQGWFKEGIPHGKGRLIFETGAIEEGQWVNGKKQGLFKQRFESGDSFTGEYKDDKRHGQGTYKSADGRSYVGSYANGKKEGAGIFTKANGNKLEGEYKDDEKIGIHLYTFKNGAQKRVKYPEGVWI